MTLSLAALKEISSYFFEIEERGAVLVIVLKQMLIDSALMAVVLALKIDAHDSKNCVLGIYYCILWA